MAAPICNWVFNNNCASIPEASGMDMLLLVESKQPFNKVEIKNAEWLTGTELSILANLGEKLCHLDLGESETPLYTKEHLWMYNVFAK